MVRFWEDSARESATATGASSAAGRKHVWPQRSVNKRQTVTPRMHVSLC